jgi:hypothetical protein
MSTVRSSGRKFAQAMTDHILGDIDGHMPAAIMHRDCVSNHLGEDRARPAPGPQHFLLALLIHLLNPTE